MRVVYIAGWGRSGSTLLAALLGQLDGAFAAGEARSFWQRGLLQRDPCGCGRPVPDCAVWAASAAAAPSWPMAPAELARFQADHLRTRHYVTAWPRLRRRGPSDDERRYAATYRCLHECLAAATGAEVVIDSSKYPLDAYLLGEVAGLDLAVVHLVRDPRAVAHSWTKAKPLTPEPGAATLKTFPPASSSAIWTTWNLMVERLLRSAPVHTVRYEDLAADPIGTIAGISRFAGLVFDPPADASELELPVNHMVAGNPARFRTGNVPVVEDEQWKTAMSTVHRLEASVPALPLLRRYGYPLWR